MKNEPITITIDEETLRAYEEHYFSIHKRARKKPIRQPYHESINTWMIMRRPEMNALKQRWKDFIIWLTEKLGYSGLNIDRCVVCHTVYYPTHRRHDTDNSTPKFILDGLVASGMITDDDCRHITQLVLKCGVDQSHPRTEIQIIPEDGNEEKEEQAHG